MKLAYRGIESFKTQVLELLLRIIAVAGALEKLPEGVVPSMQVFFYGRKFSPSRRSIHVLFRRSSWLRVPAFPQVQRDLRVPGPRGAVRHRTPGHRVQRVGFCLAHLSNDKV